MPSVSCSMERGQQFGKDVKLITNIFVFGLIVILCGLIIYSSRHDRCCRDYVPYSLVALLVGFIAILCGVVKLATCSFRLCEACEIHGSAASVQTDPSSCLMSEQSPPSYELVAATPITTSSPTPPPKYEDAVNPLFFITGRLPPYSCAAGDESAAAEAADNFGSAVLRISRKWLRRSRSRQAADGGQRNSAVDVEDVAVRLAPLDERTPDVEL